MALVLCPVCGKSHSNAEPHCRYCAHEDARSAKPGWPRPGIWISAVLSSIAILGTGFAAAATSAKAGVRIATLERILWAVAGVVALGLAVAKWMGLRLERTRSGMVSLVASLLMCGAAILGCITASEDMFSAAFGFAFIVNYYAWFLESKERRFENRETHLGEIRNRSTARN